MRVCPDCNNSEDEVRFTPKGKRCAECAVIAARKWREDNPDRYKAYNKEYYRKNKEDIHERVAEWLKERPNYHSERGKRYYQENKERFRGWQQEWIDDNYERWLEIKRTAQNKRRARKEGLEDTLTTKDWDEILEKYNYKCIYCKSDKNIQQDHYIPLHRGGPTTRENIVPACESCNKSKSGKHPQKWMAAILRRKMRKLRNIKKGVI